MRWSDFQPEPDRIDRTMMDRFEQVLEAAHKAKIGVIPTFFCGHMSGENWDVPWRGGRDPYTDPEMLRHKRFKCAISPWHTGGAIPGSSAGTSPTSRMCS